MSMWRRRAAIAAAAVPAALGLVACSVVFGIDSRDYTGVEAGFNPIASDAGTIDGSANDAANHEPGLEDAATADANGCPWKGGPSPVRVSRAAGDFCIDATEVTNGQYAEFLRAGGASGAAATDSRCTWKSSNTPGQSWPPAPGEESLPVVWVDWCDAFAFCAWAGKRLCGALGGGSLAPYDSTSATRSQWMYACTAGGTSQFAYGGDSYKPGVCDTQGVARVDAGSLVGCQGGFPGIFDMSGNVEEWEDTCEAATDGGPSNDRCAWRGGSYNDGSYPTNYRCDIAGSYYMGARSVRSLDIGFRCCSP
jgi:formylglycine-generating enzyme required for sulfatase activity